MRPFAADSSEGGGGLGLALAAGVSPALVSGDRPPAYEAKHVVSESMAAAIEVWARQHLARDPHGDSSLGDAYRIQSIYLDTPGLDVFHQQPAWRRRKFRIRRYGAEELLYLERKMKRSGQVNKRRTPICAADVDLLRGESIPAGWPGKWFHRRILAGRLRPVCAVSYLRSAYVGRLADAPIRLTLDRHVHCHPTCTWSITQPAATLLLVPGQVVLELKYCAAMPALFKRLVQEFNLNPSSCSKYRQAVSAWRLDQVVKEAG